MKLLSLLWKHKFSILAMVTAVVLVNWIVAKFKKPGQLDVITAQAMDMSDMRPPTGSAPVHLETVESGAIGNVITYTGSVRAYNEQDIAARVTGRIVSMPVYPGDRVKAGQLVAQLDTAELTAKANEASAQAKAADQSYNVAYLNHTLHHAAALDQAEAQYQVSVQGVHDAQQQSIAANASVEDARASLESSKANADYWKVEIAREKQLADAGAASQQEYQNELSQAKAAAASLESARAKLIQAQAMKRSAQAKVSQARKQVMASQANKEMASADINLAAEQAKSQKALADVAHFTQQEAAIVAGYTHITAPSSGVVIERTIAPGTLVQPGMVIMKTAEIDRVRLQANVATSDIGDIAIGTPVTAVINNVNTTSSHSGGAKVGYAISTRVTAIFPNANDQTKTAVVEAIVENPNHKILPGSYVTMQFSTTGSSSGLLIPADSIAYDSGNAYVWVAKDGQTNTVKYKAVICGQIYSAADAAKYHYICPMDHGKLVPVKNEAAGNGSQLTAHRIEVNIVSSNGKKAQIAAPDLQPGDQLIADGFAGLHEGDAVVATPWGTTGPAKLPTAANAGNAKRYRCTKCNMIYSAADAKKNNFKDPMDGGDLVPVE